MFDDTQAQRQPNVSVILRLNFVGLASGQSQPTRVASLQLSPSQQVWQAALYFCPGRSKLEGYVGL